MSGFATLIIQTTDLIPSGKVHLRDTTHDGARALDAFLAGVERKAFRIAQIALRHEADALDVVQDAMLQLSSRYAARPPEEWRPLFYRILENRVRDVQRRRSVRNRVMAYMPWRADDQEDAADPIDQAVDRAPEAGIRAAQFRGSGCRRDGGDHEMLAGQLQDTLFPRAARAARQVWGVP